MSSRSKRPILPPGTVIGDFKLVRLLGQGGYGDIYKCTDQRNDECLAIKVEGFDSRKRALAREYQVMRSLDSPHFPRLVMFGETDWCQYLTMEACGPSLSTIRRLMPNGQKFSLSTVLRVSVELLRGIEAIHERGILHRDVKPSNVLVRASRKYPLALLDYGLSRAYTDPETGEMIPPRTRPGFVGTSRYASLNAHIAMELGRRDDLISWVYSWIELWAGRLPWDEVREKDKMYTMKRTTDIATVIKDMPKQMLSVYRLVRRMEREDKPDYKLLTAFICEAMTENGVSWDEPWDWDEMDVSDISAISLSPPIDERAIVPEDLPPAVMPPREFTPLAGTGQDARMGRRETAMQYYQRMQRGKG